MTPPWTGPIEYTAIHEYSPSTHGELVVEMNKLGEEGWLLVGIQEFEASWRFIFARPKKTAKKPGSKI